MSDLGQSLRFGANVDPTADDPGWPLRLARAVDDAGLDLIGIQDHPYNSGFLDTWTLIAMLLQATERVHIFPNVANLPLRPPVMLAKAVATADVLSGGRAELGLGAGAFRQGIEAMGGPGRTKGESVAALEEAVQIIRAYWSERSVRFAGTHYSVSGARPGPHPAHAIGLWLGTYGPRTLALTGRLADGWLPSSSYAPPERLPEMQQRISDAAAAAGREPRDIRRIYNVMGLISESGPVQDIFVGPLDYWVEELTRLVVEVGMDSFIYWPADDRLRQIERFAAEVVPVVRQRVAQARGGA